MRAAILNDKSSNWTENVAQLVKQLSAVCKSKMEEYKELKIKLNDKVRFWSKVNR